MNTKERDELVRVSAEIMAAEIGAYKSRYTGYCNYMELANESVNAALFLLDEVERVIEKNKK